MGDDTADDLARVGGHLGIGRMLVDQAAERCQRLCRPKLILEEGEQRESPRLEAGAGPNPPAS